MVKNLISLILVAVVSLTASFNGFAQDVKKDSVTGKYGLVSRAGDPVTPCEYDTMIGLRGRFILKKDGASVCID